MEKQFELSSNVESRIATNPHFARLLRLRLKARHGKGTTVRRLLDSMTDEQVIAAYADHSRLQIRRHAAKDQTQRHRTEQVKGVR